MQITGAANSPQAVQNTNRTASDDPEITNLQNQIAELQKQIQSLSENDSLDPKAKSEKKQELQKQIADLNSEIRQRRIQAQKEKQASAKPAQTDAAPKRFKDGFDEKDTSTLLAASSSLEQSKTVGSVIKRAEGRASILTTEIAIDKSRGADTTYKEKELEKIEEHTEAAKENLAEETEKSGEADKDGADDSKGKDKPEETDEKRSGAVAVNVGKRNRQISAAKSLSQIQMVLSLVQKDIADCKNGKQQGMCDDDEIAKAEALMKQAQEKLSEIRGQSSEEQEENEKDLSFYTTLLL